MAAPLGFKTFTTGEVLTAADTNGYLMQGIWTFANAAARDAAVTVPVEGNTCYLKDTDVIQVYSGSAWVTKSGSPSPLTTKGDVYTFSTVDARIGVGANDTVLTADSTTATGLKWAAAATGGAYTTLASGSLSSDTLTLSSISSAYTDLLLRVTNIDVSADTSLLVRINGSTGTVYGSAVIRSNTTTQANATSGTSFPTGTSDIGNFAQFGAIFIEIPSYAGANHYKSVSINTAYVNAASVKQTAFTQGIYAEDAAVTSISFFTSGATFTGSYRLIGVK